MKVKQIIVIGLGAVLVLSAVLSAVSFSPPAPTITRQQLNSELNGLVNECMQTLPDGLSQCDDQLRTIVTSLCEQEPSLDACSDGRVEEYYKARKTSG